MIKRLLNSRSKTVAFSAFLLAISSLLSRILGLLRDRLLASRFGAGAELDVYFAAFRIPDFVYTVLIIGGVTAAFLPMLSKYFNQNKKEGEWDKEVSDFVNNLLNSILVIVSFVCFILAVFTPWIVKLTVPGFSESQKEITVIITRIMFLSPVFFGMSAVFSGILQYFDKFLIYSLCPILYNLGIIAGILFFVPYFGVYGLAYGVILGAFLYFIIQIPPSIHSGFKYRWVFDFKHPGILSVFKLTVPRIIGTATEQMNWIILTAIASLLASGSIAIFTFSHNLFYFPVGLIGISFAVSSFPVFSKYLANGQKKEFLANFALTFRQVLFLIIPVSILLFLLRAQVVRLVLGAGQFDWRDTRLTAASLGVFCFGIAAISLVSLITKAFYAFHDTKTPLVVSVVSVASSVFFGFFFVYLMGFSNIFSNFLSDFLVLQNISNIEVIALPMAIALSSIIQMVLLLFFLYKRAGDFHTKEILVSFKKIAIAVIIMSFAAYFVRQFSGVPAFMQTFLGVLLQVFLTGVIGSAVYLISAWILKSPEIGTFKDSLVKQIKKSDYGTPAN